MNSMIPTIVTVQKWARKRHIIPRFLSAFIDRLSKAKQSLEGIDGSVSGMTDMKQLSTRIIQQWNTLFPNNPICSIDHVSSNTLIATKTRYVLFPCCECRDEVVLDRSNQQKQKLIMEVEVLRARLHKQQEETVHLQEEYAYSCVFT